MSAATTDTMRLALLGCGYAARLHSRSLRALGKRVARYYVSRNIAKADEYNRRYGGAGAIGTYQEAIEHPDIDVIAVLTPPSYHLDTTLQALRAGKDVIVEKPPYLHARDFDAVEAACRDTGRRVFVAENYYYKPLAMELRKLLADGVVGEVLFIQLNAIKLQKTGNWRDQARLAGAGALFEGGIHWVNFLANLGLDVCGVSAVQPGASAEDARSSNAAPGQRQPPMDRSMLVTLQYQQGAVATLAYSWEVPSTLKGVRLSRIFGREGSILFESNGIFMFVNGSKRSLQFPGLLDIQGYRAMFRDFYRAWRDGGQPAMDLAKARRDLDIIEEAYRSAERAQEARQDDLPAPQTGPRSGAER